MARAWFSARATATCTAQPSGVSRAGTRAQCSVWGERALMRQTACIRPYAGTTSSDLCPTDGHRCRGSAFKTLQGANGIVTPGQGQWHRRTGLNRRQVCSQVALPAHAATVLVPGTPALMLLVRQGQPSPHTREDLTHSRKLVRTHGQGIRRSACASDKRKAEDTRKNTGMQGERHWRPFCSATRRIMISRAAV